MPSVLLSFRVPTQSSPPYSPSFSSTLSPPSLSPPALLPPQPRSSTKSSVSSNRSSESNFSPSSPPSNKPITVSSSGSRLISPIFAPPHPIRPLRPVKIDQDPDHPALQSPFDDRATASLCSSRETKLRYLVAASASDLDRLDIECRQNSLTKVSSTPSASSCASSICSRSMLPIFKSSSTSKGRQTLHRPPSPSSLIIPTGAEVHLGARIILRLPSRTRWHIEGNSRRLGPADRDKMPMDSEVDALEEKLTSLLGQLQTESVILERMVYKNKNQHRRCSYFQYLLKVRRDLRLLQSAKLEDILNSCFEVITGRRPRQKVHLLESLKRRKCEGEKYNFMDRLLGAARLLSQMVEPMLKASIEISTLLARSFFMGFSLTILALLARIRVLVQQILLDVVSVFNMVSSLSRKKQSVKIAQDGLEVFREIFPTKEEFATLECVWKSDKFLLLERKHKSEISSHGGDLEGNASLRASAVQYQILESFLGDELHSKRMDEDHAAKQGLTHTQEGNTDLSPGVSIGDDDGKVVEGCLKIGDASSIAEIPSKKFPQGGLLPGTSSFPSSNAFSKLQSGSRRVAFVSVKNPQPSACSVSGLNLKETESKSDSKDDAFFSLLTAGNTKDSLF